MISRTTKSGKKNHICFWDVNHHLRPKTLLGPEAQLCVFQALVPGLQHKWPHVSSCELWWPRAVPRVTLGSGQGEEEEAGEQGSSGSWGTLCPHLSGRQDLSSCRARGQLPKPSSGTIPRVGSLLPCTLVLPKQQHQIW